MKNPIQARNDEFIAICLSIISRNKASGRRNILSHIVDEAIHRKPRCHYTTYDHAARILCYIDRCGVSKMPRRLAVLKWLELYNQVSDAMKGPRQLPFGKALSFVLGFQRPSRFYIDHSRALRILHNHIKLSGYTFGSQLLNSN